MVSLAEPAPESSLFCASGAAKGSSRLGPAATLGEATAEASTLVASELAAVVLTDDDRVRLLNRDYRDKDRATNVLSFPAFDADDMARLPVDAPLFLGDVFIALETATAEAVSESKTTTDHLIHLVVHGMLHLLGHDHETDDEANIMERLESDVLAQLGRALRGDALPGASAAHAAGHRRLPAADAVGEGPCGDRTSLQSALCHRFGKRHFD